MARTWTGVRRRAERHTIPVQLPGFVGREAELALLNARFGEARAGKGGVVVLCGEPGIGKSCLAERFATAAERTGAVVLCGSWYEGETNQPYGPIARVLGAYASLVEPV
jgi:predicted ATPase